jgi:hypothetical protein
LAENSEETKVKEPLFDAGEGKEKGRRMVELYAGT